MTLYEQWRALAETERTQQETDQFWQDYFELEKENYKKILGSRTFVYEDSVHALAESFSMEDATFVGFLDGINSSLKQELELEKLEEETKIKLAIDLQKLYFNMLNAKADWLYELPEWDGILSTDERKEITKQFRASKIYVNDNKVGRNDPCLCGSGKKYKNCCGR